VSGLPYTAFVPVDNRLPDLRNRLCESEQLRVAQGDPGFVEEEFDVEGAACGSRSGGIEHARRSVGALMQVPMFPDAVSNYSARRKLNGNVESMTGFAIYGDSAI
jgi:hypothetical protein